MKVIVGITGASGSIYAVRLLNALADLGVETHVIFSEMGEKVMKYECKGEYERIVTDFPVYKNSDLFSSIASGSNRWDGMAIVPCSVNTMGAIANGIGDTLLLRTASVTLKESRKLVVLVRETPMSLINLENMCRLGKAGACMMPAAPGFYNHPTTIQELADGLVSRILDQLTIENHWSRRWRERR